MIRTSICIYCGAEKHLPQIECDECHRSPSTLEEKAKSMILSDYYEIEGEYRGFTDAKLKQIGADIRSGTKHLFDEAEVKSVAEYLRHAASITTGQLIWDLLRWLAPVIVLALMLYFLGHGSR